jgi:hypothetical protein
VSPLPRCPEFDTFEGNKETMNVALHTCDYVVSTALHFTALHFTELA